MAEKLDHLTLYRPGTGTMWILKNTAGSFAAVYRRGDPGDGIGGYDLRSGADRAFAFDYDSSGVCDHLVLYRPGTGTIWIIQNNNDTNDSFAPVYHQGDPGSGIGGYDLRSGADIVMAFDYDSSGKQDHLLLYRPGTGTIWILKNSGGAFSAVYHQGDPGNGIGGYDLKSRADRAFAFDYDGSGKQDHLALYRPGTGTIWILKNSGGAFSAVYHQGDPGSGIGGYDLKSPFDRAFAFDYDGSGKQDHLALYRPGTGTIWILKNSRGVFSAVYHQGDPGNGIGGYDLKSRADRAFAFDYDGSGKQDHLALYRPGTGTIWILKNSGGAFSAVYHQGDPGSGIGGYDLRSGSDQIFAFADPVVNPRNPVPVPPSGLGSNSNYILYNGCQPILGLTITINITQDIVCQSASGSIKGFSFQLNCYSPQKEKSAWQQYLIAVFGTQIVGAIDNWPINGPNIINDFFNLTATPNGTLIGGTQLRIILLNDAASNITGATYMVIDNQGQAQANQTVILTSLPGITTADIAPIIAFELNLVGPVNSESAVLSSGAGTIDYAALTPLTVLNAEPPCAESGYITAETANSFYGTLSATPNSKFSQGFSTSKTAAPIRKIGRPRPSSILPPRRFS